MSSTPEYLNVLKSIELAVVNLWRVHPEMTNYTVSRAYEAAIARYHNLERGMTPKEAALTGLDLQVYNAVVAVCEWCLGQGPSPSQKPLKLEATPTLEEMTWCLRKLKKSADHWTQRSGRQGYLNFIDSYL